MPQASTSTAEVSHCTSRLLHSTLVARSLIERRLTELGGRLKELRKELAVVDEQLDHLSGR